MKRTLVFFLFQIIILSLAAHAAYVGEADLNAVIEDAARYLCETAESPTVGTVGGEWAVLGLSRSGADVPEGYFDAYYENVKEYVKQRGGVLSERKYTEYSRVVLALTAIGKAPSDVSGYNLLMPLGDYEKTVKQGINGAVWALIALDSADYEIPKNESARVQATRDMYVDFILERQTSDGGWALNGDLADADVTAMALQALSRYLDDERVKAAADKAITLLSQMQNPTGGFSSGGAETSESCAQVIAALCELGISIDDESFVKNGNTLLDNLMSYYDGNGGFKHTADGQTNRIASEQCFYSLASLKRISEGKSSLYRMNGKIFSDIIGHESRAAIEALAEKGIINGKADGVFDPYGNVTRAEFAAIIVRSLGLEKTSGKGFSDVRDDDWFYGYVSTAAGCGIINGVSETEFLPYGIITLQEAAVMLKRAAALCGINAETPADAEFAFDGRLSDWAADSAAFCAASGIISVGADVINPLHTVNRAETAQMIYNLLCLAELV